MLLVLTELEYAYSKNMVEFCFPLLTEAEVVAAD